MVCKRAKKAVLFVEFPPDTNFVISRTFAEDLKFYLNFCVDAEIWNVGQITRAMCKHGAAPLMDQI